ncbi:M48 family metalloprotease [Streptobacillus felis]|uniref:M48 family metalloprotease n=2 Tax=Streptobacillus felis TaxID=1384509 RepID=A0A7Z0PET2_9FUSO|nr:M48 family metalloprotease [Streptobacillus felis]
MYLLHFFRNLFHKKNTGILIFFFINIMFIYFLFSLAGTSSFNFIYAILLYLFSLYIALSPIGERIIRWQLGCKQITNPVVKNRLDRIFYEVYNKANISNPELADDIEIFMTNDMYMNAFATGRKTICVTRGLYENLNDEQIEAVLAHEFSHILHKDTDLLLIIMVSNMIMNFILIIARSFAHIFAVNMSKEKGYSYARSRIMIDLLISGVFQIWTKLGVMLVLSSSRNQEFVADGYAKKLGYGETLANVLYILNQGNVGKHSLAQTLMSSHPSAGERIEKLREV